MRHPESPAAKPDAAFAQSLAAYRAGDSATALRLARRAARHGNDPAPPRLLALMLAEAGQIVEALDWASRALALDPGEPTAHAALGRILLQAGQPDAAEQRFRAALAIDPASKPAQDGLAAIAALHHRTGLALFGAKDFTKAADALAAAARIATSNAGLLHDLATAQLEAGDTAAAHHSFQRAVALDPHRADTWHNLGSLLQAMHDLDGALHAYARAWRLRPDTLPRIAQELAAGPSGQVWLSAAGLTRRLAQAAPPKA